MKEFKGTKGPLERKYVSSICIGIGTVGDYAEMTANSIIPDTDAGTKQMEADMQLYATAPEMLKALQKAKLTISRLKLSIAVHPDCEPGSEFGDRVNSAQAVEDEIEGLIKKATTI